MPNRPLITNTGGHYSDQLTKQTVKPSPRNFASLLKSEIVPNIRRRVMLNETGSFHPPTILKLYVKYLHFIWERSHRYCLLWISSLWPMANLLATCVPSLRLLELTASPCETWEFEDCVAPSKFLDSGVTAIGSSISRPLYSASCCRLFWFSICRFCRWARKRRLLHNFSTALFRSHLFFEK